MSEVCTKEIVNQSYYQRQTPLADAINHLAMAKVNVRFAEHHIVQIRINMSQGGLSYSEIGTTQKEMQDLKNWSRAINAMDCIYHGNEKQCIDSRDFGIGLLKKSGLTRYDVSPRARRIKEAKEILSSIESDYRFAANNIKELRAFLKRHNLNFSDIDVDKGRIEEILAKKL